MTSTLGATTTTTATPQPTPASPKPTSGGGGGAATLVTRNVGLALVGLYVLSMLVVAAIVYALVVCDKPHVLDASPMSNRTRGGNATASTTTATRTTSVATTTKPAHELDIRLPRDVVPISYRLHLVPFLGAGRNFTFAGNVSIRVRIAPTAKAGVERLVLHAADLSIRDEDARVLDELDANRRRSVRVLERSSDARLEQYSLVLGERLRPGGEYSIELRFAGTLNDDLRGFYRSSYKSDNETRWIATTQFQPTDARRAFPCFDEPAMKARFTISIAHPKEMNAISNMNMISRGQATDGLPDYVWTHFNESLPMSTYLVAFIVSDFAHMEDGNFRVWARPGAIETASYALEVGPKILRYFEKFYRIDYPLPKIELIALPDFNAGAMENWGLLTFRETAMLYEEGVSATINKPRVATVIAHELAHQWFGNLVTPSWWSDLWLNEGFATYVEYVGVDAVETDWKLMDQFMVSELQGAFGLDALSSSHQISVQVGHPDEINEIFDKISYSKGASIIRMMDHFLTGEVFHKGITNYLNDKKYQTAEQNDLWKALTDQARRDRIFDNSTSVDTIMGTWTLQTGFPVVTVRRDYNSKSINLHQERFMLIRPTSAKGSKETKEPLWWVPITYTTKSTNDFETTKPVAWMKGVKEMTLNRTNALNDDWVIFNIQQTGFYRVNYDARNWALIAAHLNDPASFSQIATKNRAQILDDALNLAQAGALDYALALNVTRYLKHERESAPWKAGIAGLGYIDSMLSKGPHYVEYKNYIKSIIEDVYREVDFKDDDADSMMTVYKRIDIIGVACLMDHEDCVRKAVTHFENWRASPTPDVDNAISPNLRNTVYCTAVRVGGDKEWQFVRERYANAQLASERELLIWALGCTRQPHLINRYLYEACRNDTGFRKQDLYRVFTAVSNSAVGQRLAFDYIRENWHAFKAYVGSSSLTFNSIVKYATRRMNSRHELDELKRFYDERRGELGRMIEQSIEKNEANVMWMERNYDTIVKWLYDNNAAAS